MLNEVILVGRMTKDPELTFTSNGSGVTKFTLAVNRSYGDETDFINIECWNRGNYKLAEYVAQDCLKGNLVTVKGELRIEKYKEKYYTKVNADKVVYQKNKTSQENKNQNGLNDDADINDNFDVPF